VEGYIKLWRKFEQWEWFNDSKMVHFFIFLMLRATHGETKFRGYPLSRGQMVFGYKAASKATVISVQSLRTCIERLISTGELTRQVTHDFSIITIVNYDTYQKKDSTLNSPTNRPSNNQATGQQQAINNIQECKNDKNEKRTRTFSAPSLEDVKNYVAEISSPIDPLQFHSKQEAIGWMVGKNPMKDWKATIRYWGRCLKGKTEQPKKSKWIAA